MEKVKLKLCTLRQQKGNEKDSKKIWKQLNSFQKMKGKQFRPPFKMRDFKRPLFIGVLPEKGERKRR